MAELVQVPNFDQRNLNAYSYLSSDIVANATSASIDNVLNFINDGLVIYGKQEQAEAFRTQSIVNQVLNINGNFSFNHRHGNLIRQVFGDTANIWRAAALVDNTPPPIANFSLLGALQLVFDQFTTGFLDQTGGIGYWYIFVYYDSILLNITDINDAIPVRGGGYGNYCTLQDIIDEAGASSLNIDYTRITKARAIAQQEVKGGLASAGYLMPLQSTTGVFYVPDNVSYITALLAAGMYLFKNFSTTNPSTAKDGKAKMDEARHMIATIQLNDTILLDYNGQQLAKPLLVDGWPDDTTMDDGKNVGPIATMKKIF